MHAAPDPALLGEFLVGYLVILLTPGPTMLVLAGVASLRGLRATVPFCAGLALGAGALCAAIAMSAQTEFRRDATLRLIAAALLVWMASGIARRRTGETTRVRMASACGAGFGTSVAIPLTAAYFVSAALDQGCLPTMPVAAPIAVVLVAFMVYLAIAGMLATPAARRTALRFDRPMRMVAAGTVLLMAARVAWPLLAA